MIRTLTFADTGHIVDLCIQVFGADARFVASTLPASFQSGQALGEFDGSQLVGIRISDPLTVAAEPCLKTRMLAVLPEFRQRDIATALAFAGRDDALKRGIKTIVASVDLLNVETVSLCLNKLGYTASKLSRPGNTFRCDFVWNLDGQRAIAAAAGLPIPGAVDREVVISAVKDSFAAGLSLIGFRQDQGQNVYLMGRL